MGPRARAGFLFAVLSLAAGALGACGELLNVDGVVIVEALEGASGAGGTLGEVPCQAGTFRCEGPALQLCEEREGTFRTVRVCSSAELCCDDPEQCGGQPGCQAPVCSAGEHRCRGDLLEACNAGQTGFVEVDRCPSALHCNASQGRCTLEPCDADSRERHCNGPVLEACLPGRTEWSPLGTCPTHELCSVEDECLPSACWIGSPASPSSPYICVGGNLMRCNDGQTGWKFVETCLNTANCNALIGALVGDPHWPNMPTEQLEQLGCTLPTCAPGRYLCKAEELFLCNANRTGYIDLVGTCMSPRHCDAARGVCSPEPCIIGVHQCSGDEYQVCTETGWQTQEVCSSGAPCDPLSGCLDAQCRPNEYRCAGAELERCNVERTGWIPVRSCESEALCNVAAKRCDAPTCSAGSVRCTREGVLERCAADRSGWERLADCAAQAGTVGPARSASCDPSGAGACLPATACAAGALRCNDAELERCRDGVWRPFLHCATAALCDAIGGACRAPACEPGSFRCVSPRDPDTAVEAGASLQGLTLQACNAAGTGYDVVRTCGALSLCDAVQGQCDICDPTLPALCAGNELRVCTADGQEQTLYELCAEGCVEADVNGSMRATCREDIEDIEATATE